MIKMFRLLVPLAALLVLAGMAAPTRACSLDGVPSITANGARAHLNTVVATASNLTHWAPFIFPASYHKGTAIRLAEDRRLVLKSLPPDTFAHGWRWSFGDGASATGFSVNHRYSRAGTYTINLFAYYPSFKAWFKFDSVLIHVR